MSDRIPAEAAPEQEAIHEGWGAPLDVFYCTHCHAAHLASPGVTLRTCPACLQAGVSPEPERMRREPPELVIPFAVGKERAAEALASWARGTWFRPGDMSPATMLDRMQHYYLPLWLVDADVEATWQAEAGFDYQAASFREHYRGGQWVSQQVAETRVRWEPRVGRMNRHYDNVVVAALDAHTEWMSRLGGYDYRTRKAYTPRAISGSVIRVPDRGGESAWPDAERAIERLAEMDCQAASGADHMRGWATQAEYRNVRWTQMLVPTYVTWYREEERAYPVWINGQNARVYGVKVLSQRKANATSLAIGAVAVLLFSIAALRGLLGAVLIAPVAIAVIVGIIGLALGLVAPVPAIWAWAHNRGRRTGP